MGGGLREHGLSRETGAEGDRAKRRRAESGAGRGQGKPPYQWAGPTDPARPSERRSGGGPACPLTSQSDCHPLRLQAHPAAACPRLRRPQWEPPASPETGGGDLANTLSNTGRQLCLAPEGLRRQPEIASSISNREGSTFSAASTCSPGQQAVRWACPKLTRRTRNPASLGLGSAGISTGPRGRCSAPSHPDQ